MDFAKISIEVRHSSGKGGAHRVEGIRAEIQNDLMNLGGVGRHRARDQTAMHRVGDFERCGGLERHCRAALELERRDALDEGERSGG